MSPKKKNTAYEKEIMDRVEELLKKRIKKIEENIETNLEKLKKNWEEIYERKTEETTNQFHQRMEGNNKRLETLEKRCSQLEEQVLRSVSATFKKNDNYRASNIEITHPSFYGNNKDSQPLDFIQRLEEYFKIKQVDHEERFIIIGDCLKGSAENWFATIKFQIRNYTKFRDIFIDEYWSRDIQIQIWSSCLNITQIPTNTSYREHFSTWASRLRYLQVTQLSEEEIVRNIANHYPGYIRAILISLLERTIFAAMKLLGEDEYSREQPDRDTPRNEQRND
jgi:hypothetical protein